MPRDWLRDGYHPLLSIAERHGVQVVDDNAHGLFAKYKGRLLGTFGVLAKQCFRETKNVICGEGGALIINDLLLAERAGIICEKGAKRGRSYRVETDRYTWMAIGSSFLISDHTVQ